MTIDLYINFVSIYSLEHLPIWCVTRYLPNSEFGMALG